MIDRDLPVSPLVDPKEAARILGVSVGTLAKWRMVPDKGPRFVRCGSRCRYTAVAIQDFIDSRECDSTVALREKSVPESV